MTTPNSNIGPGSATGMRVAFRVDATEAMGTGHAMRCLTLAMALREYGARVMFVSAAMTAGLRRRLQEEGFPLVRLTLGQAAPPPYAGAALAQDLRHDAELTTAAISKRLGQADWLIVDHYGIDARWESAARAAAGAVAVIDDLADRPHDCAFLLDQTLGRREMDYTGLIAHGTRTLLGPRYALLRPQFAGARAAALLRRRRTSTVQDILLNFGGADATNVTQLVMMLLAEIPIARVNLTVVMGKDSPHLAAVRNLARRLNPQPRIVCGVTDMARYMAEADLAIGAAGTSSWERCSVGLPTVVISVADNQWHIARRLHAAGAAVHAGSEAQIRAEPKRLLDPVRHLITDSAYRSGVSRAAATITDGLGAARVCAILSRRGRSDTRPVVTPAGTGGRPCG